MLNHEKGASPLYAQLEAILKGKIEHGEYNKGDQFPTEKMIMEEYQVSRVTVRQAFAALTQSGYIKSSRGIGTTVIFEKIEEHLEQVISFTEEMRRHNITMNTSFCEMKLVKPDTQVAMALKIPKTESCYCLKRVRCVEGSPLVYTVTWLKEKVKLPLEPESYLESLYAFLREQFDLRIEKGIDTLEAALPSEEVRNHLQIDERMPVFKRTRQTFLPGDEIFEYSVCYYPGNRYKYTVEL